MTELLMKAFAEAANLPENDQDVLAKALLEDLAAEEKWDQAFANSHDRLAALADEAIAEFEQDETRLLEQTYDIPHNQVFKNGNSEPPTRTQQTGC